MSSTAESAESQTRTYGNWRRPRSRGLLGMELSATLIALSVALFIAIERATPAPPVVAAVPSEDREP